jgi:hypothetical protein
LQAAGEASAAELERGKASLAELQASYTKLQGMHRTNTATAKRILAKNKAMEEEQTKLQVRQKAEHFSRLFVCLLSIAFLAARLAQPLLLLLLLLLCLLMIEALRKHCRWAHVLMAGPTPVIIKAFSAGSTDTLLLCFAPASSMFLLNPEKLTRSIVLLLLTLYCFALHLLRSCPKILPTEAAERGSQCCVLLHLCSFSTALLCPCLLFHTCLLPTEAAGGGSGAAAGSTGSRRQRPYCCCHAAEAAACTGQQAQAGVGGSKEGAHICIRAACTAV